MRTNVPSWCDRILWKSYPETHIVCNSYGEWNHLLISYYFFSLTDRLWDETGRHIFVLYRQFRILVYILVFFLGCTDDIVTSDHSPVFATFEVGVTSQFVSKKGKNNKHNSF